MRRPLTSLLLLLLLPATAHAGPGKFFAGEVADDTGGVVRLTDVDVSRGGDGAVAYLRRDLDGVHAYVQRLVRGQLQGPERVDGGVPGEATDVVASVADGGRMAAAFVTGGGVYVVVRPAGQGLLPPQQLAVSGSDPSIDMSVGGHAYAVFRSGGDLRAARMDRREQQFTGLADALDVEAGRDAGENGEPRVATSADGSAIATWGEGGRVIARRLFGLNVSRAPQVLADAGSDPDIGIEDDSSYAWAVFRTPSGTFARRARGSGFDEPVRIDREGDPGVAPRVAVSGRGEGYAASTGSASGQVLGAVIKDDKFFAPTAIGQSPAGVGRPVPAVAENGDGVIASFAADGTVKARSYDNNPRSRVATPPNPEVTLSEPGADPLGGLEADSNRAGDVLIAWKQGGRLVTAVFDRFPGAFTGTTGTKPWRPTLRPELRWAPSFELWGAITYRVEVDGQPVGETTDTRLVPGVDIPDGLHRWVVVATDRRGQTNRSKPRNLRIDATPPTLEVDVRRVKGKAAIVTAEVTDDPGTGAKASGVAFVRFQVGSGAPVTLTKPPFRIRRPRKGTVRVSATDLAGNATVDTARLGG